MYTEYIYGVLVLGPRRIRRELMSDCPEPPARGSLFPSQASQAQAGWLLVRTRRGQKILTKFDGMDSTGPPTSSPGLSAAMGSMRRTPFPPTRRLFLQVPYPASSMPV